MNMSGLWILGPFVEAILGTGKFVFVYLVSGVCALMLAGVTQANNPQLTVGASGAIMGLIGAMGAIMAGGWYRNKANIAKRRLGGIVAIVAMQTVFDLLIPGVSMTAHLSGVMFGFFLTLPFAAKLRTH